jgi:hypothetical protein
MEEEEKRGDENSPTRNFAKRPTGDVTSLSHGGIVKTEERRMGKKGAKDLVIYTEYKISGCCDDCVGLREAWKDAVATGNVHKECIALFNTWAHEMYEQQKKDMGTVFPNGNDFEMTKHTPLAWMAPMDIDQQEDVRVWQEEYAQWFDKEGDAATIWVCYDEQDIAVIRAVKSSKNVPQMHAVISNESLAFSRKIRAMVDPALQMRKVVFTEECPSTWRLPDGILYLVGVLEEAVRSSTFTTKFDIRTVIEQRMRFALTTICEHKQRLWRNDENQYATGRMKVPASQKKSNKVLQTVSNVFGIGQSFCKAEIIIKPHEAPNDPRRWETIVPGEMGPDSQQLWVGNKFGVMLIHRTDDVITDVWQAYNAKKQYDEKYINHDKKARPKPKIDTCDTDTPISNQSLLQDLRRTTKEWQHSWTEQQTYPYPYNSADFDALFQDTGFVVLQFASGDKLKELQKKIRKRAEGAWKMAIINEAEVRTRVKQGRHGYGSKPAWKTLAMDISRLQTPLEDDEMMPGEEEIMNHYPETPRSNGSSRKVKVMYKNIIYNHKAGMAQNVHWDMGPESEEDVEKLRGSVLVALWETRLIIYPMSHRWSECDRPRRPITIVIPAGSILFFSTVAHAGYGVWSLDEAVFRPSPSLDDLLGISMSDLYMRYQAHIARPLDNDPNHTSINPTRTIRLHMYPVAASYLHLDRTEEPMVLYPPVFTTKGGDVSVRLLYNECEEVQNAFMREILTNTRSSKRYADEADVGNRQKVARKTHQQTTNKLVRWSLPMDNESLNNKIADKDLVIVEEVLEQKHQDLEKLLGEYSHLCDWFSWMTEAKPSVRDWREKLQEVLDDRMGKGMSMQDFGTELTAQVKWVGKFIHFPSIKAWSIYLNQNSFVNMGLEELLQVRCGQHEQMYIVVLVKYGPQCSKVLFCRSNGTVEMVASEIEAMDDLQFWVLNRLQGGNNQDVSSFAVQVVIAWMENKQLANSAMDTSQ